MASTKIVEASAREASGSRRPWLDNLRVAVIAGVIVVHVSATYAVQMPWYYEERSAGLVTQATLSALFGPGVFYAMAVLFLVAGMLSPRSLAGKGPWRFILDRLLRLGVPLVISVWLLVPLTALIGALAEGEVTSATLGPFLAYQAREVDTGVMWFVAALLAFSLTYALFRWARPAGESGFGPMRWWHLAGTMGAITLGSFLVRLVWPALSVTPGHLNLWEWPSMAALFVLGIMARERGWFDPVPDRLRRLSGWLGLAALAAATLFFAAVAVTEDDRLLGGWHLQALAGPAIEGVLAVMVSLWLLAWFRIRWTQRGPVARAAGRASYAAYVLHPLVIVLLAVALRVVAAAGEIKFVVVGGLGVIASFALGWLLTRVRPLARIL